MLDRNSLAYKRYQRHRAISRKKAICNNHMTFATIESDNKRRTDFSHMVPMEWYSYDGMYDKGKIHCSCKLCKFSRHFKLPTLRTIKEMIKYKDALEDAS